MPARFPTTLDALPDVLRLPPPPPRFDAAVTPPGSKSLTNRAVLLAALARGTSTIRNALTAGEDARAMRAGVEALGARVEEEGGVLRITGVGGRWPASGITLDLGASGTSVRFLAAAAALAGGPVTIDGSARMRERPIGELGDLLTALGCGVSYGGRPGHPPITITPGGPSPTAPTIEVAPTQSSQFISGLLLIGPWLARGLTLRLQGPVTSASYIHMSLGLLTRLGAGVRTSEGLQVVRIDHIPGGLPAFDYGVEPDATGATYFWGAAALAPGSRCRVVGLDHASLQGDSGFPEVLGRMGAGVVREPMPAGIGVSGPRRLRPILADMSGMPDAAMTLGAVACFAEGTSILRGLRTLRVKECDRIAALRTELTKLGVHVQTPVQNDPDAMTITPPPGGVDCSPGAAPVTFSTYDDHRMAMSLALVGLRRPNVSVQGPACVAKTYPTFWQDFARLYSEGPCATSP